MISIRETNDVVTDWSGTSSLSTVLRANKKIAEGNELLRAYLQSYLNIIAEHKAEDLFDCEPDAMGHINAYLDNELLIRPKNPLTPEEEKRIETINSTLNEERERLLSAWVSCFPYARKGFALAIRVPNQNPLSNDLLDFRFSLKQKIFIWDKAIKKMAGVAEDKPKDTFSHTERYTADKNCQYMIRYLNGLITSENLDDSKSQNTRQSSLDAVLEFIHSKNEQEKIKKIHHELCHKIKEIGAIVSKITNYKLAIELEYAKLNNLKNQNSDSQKQNVLIVHIRKLEEERDQLNQKKDADQKKVGLDDAVCQLEAIISQNIELRFIHRMFDHFRAKLVTQEDKVGLFKLKKEISWSNEQRDFDHFFDKLVKIAEVTRPDYGVISVSYAEKKLNDFNLFSGSPRTAHDREVYDASGKLLNLPANSGLNSSGSASFITHASLTPRGPFKRSRSHAIGNKADEKSAKLEEKTTKTEKSAKSEEKPTKTEELWSSCNQIAEQARDVARFYRLGLEPAEQGRDVANQNQLGLESKDSLFTVEWNYHLLTHWINPGEGHDYNKIVEAAHFMDGAIIPLDAANPSGPKFKLMMRVTNQGVMEASFTDSLARGYRELQGVENHRAIIFLDQKMQRQFENLTFSGNELIPKYNDNSDKEVAANDVTNFQLLFDCLKERATLHSLPTEASPNLNYQKIQNQKTLEDQLKLFEPLLKEDRGLLTIKQSNNLKESVRLRMSKDENNPAINSIFVDIKKAPYFLMLNEIVENKNNLYPSNIVEQATNQLLPVSALFIKHYLNNLYYSKDYHKHKNAMLFHSHMIALERIVGIMSTIGCKSANDRTYVARLFLAVILNKKPSENLIANVEDVEFQKALKDILFSNAGIHAAMLDTGHAPKPSGFGYFTHVIKNIFARLKTNSKRAPKYMAKEEMKKVHQESLTNKAPQAEPLITPMVQL